MLKIPAISIANMIVMSLAPVRPQHIPHSMYRTHTDSVLPTKQPELSLATQMFVIPIICGTGYIRPVHGSLMVPFSIHIRPLRAVHSSLCTHVLLNLRKAARTTRITTNELSMQANMVFALDPAIPDRPALDFPRSTRLAVETVRCSSALSGVRIPDSCRPPPWRCGCSSNLSRPTSMHSG